MDCAHRLFYLMKLHVTYTLTTPNITCMYTRDRQITLLKHHHRYFHDLDNDTIFSRCIRVKQKKYVRFCYKASKNSEKFLS